MAKNIRAGRAEVEATIKDRLEQGFARMRQKLKAFAASTATIGAGVLGTGAAIGGSMVAAAAQFASSGDELSKMSDKTGMSVEALSEMRHAASQSAVEFETFGKAVTKQQRFLAEATDGNKANRQSLKELGLDLKGLMAQTPDQQFESIAQRISEIEDPAKRANAAMTVFGKSGADLLPLMVGGAEGIKALRAEAKNLGLQVSGEDAKNATLLGDTWANVKSVMGQVVFNIGAALAPTLINLLNVVLPVITSVANFVSENRQLVLIVAGAAAGIMAAGAALIGLGTAAGVVAFAIGGFVSLIGMAGAVLGAVLSPIGLVVGALVAGVGAWLYFSGAGGTAVNYLSEVLGSLFSWAQSVFGGIYDSIVAGDWSGAASIMWTALKIVWNTGIGWLMTRWAEFKFGFITAFDNIITSIRSAWNTVTTWIADKIVWLIGKINGLVESLTGIKLISDDVVDSVREGIAQDNQAFQRMLRENQERRLEERGRLINETRQAYDTGELQKELDGMTAAAKENRVAAELAKEAVKQQTIEDFEMPDIEQQSAQLDKTATDTFGSFSAAVLQASGGGEDVTRQTAENTKAIAEYTKEMSEQLVTLAAKFAFVAT